eukprot:12690361-Prorocentrum_lima.AAC.1
MHNILQAVGAPQPAQLVSDIVDRCRVCRMSQIPPPANAATSRTTSAFNKVGQHEPMCVDSHADQAASDT